MRNGIRDCRKRCVRQITVAGDLFPTECKRVGMFDHSSVHGVSLIVIKDLFMQIEMIGKISSAPTAYPLCVCVFVYFSAKSVGEGSLHPD